MALHSIASVVAHSDHETLSLQLQHSLVSGGAVATCNTTRILQEALSMLTCTAPYTATNQVCTNITTTQTDGNSHKLYTAPLKTFADRRNTVAGQNDQTTSANTSATLDCTHFLMDAHHSPRNPAGGRRALPPPPNWEARRVSTAPFAQTHNSTAPHCLTAHSRHSPFSQGNNKITVK
jgi:hypothetical protein